MGLFRDYFFKDLRLPFVKSTGPLAMLVDGASICLDTVRDVVLTLRDQFFPDRCEADILQRFARSRGIVRSPLETDEHWVERVRFAYHWWLRGGRSSAMVEVLRIGFGLSTVKIVGLNETFPMYDETTMAPLHDETTGVSIGEGSNDRWAEFMVTLYLEDKQLNYTIDQVIWAINEIKPARSRLASIIIVAPLYDETTLANLCDETTLAPLTT